MKHIKCPYCGLEDNESYEFDQEDGTVECVDCEKEFNVSRTIEITYSTSKIACEDDEHDYKIDCYFISKRERDYTAKGGWVNLREHDWTYYRIEICCHCDAKDIIEITKDECDFALVV